MDEIENPEISALAQTTEEAQSHRSIMDDGDDASAIKPGVDTAEQLGLDSPSPDDIGSLFDDQADIPQHARGIRDSTHSPPRTAAISPAQKPSLPRDRVALPTRPILKRESSASRPPEPVQSAEPLDIVQDPPDSLTLADLKRLRSGFTNASVPRQELPASQKVYDFEYSDSGSFWTEVQEWFAYNDSEKATLQSLQTSFGRAWANHNSSDEENAPTWITSSDKATGFIRDVLATLKDGVENTRVESLQVICYLILGVWADTAGISTDQPFGIISQGDGTPATPSEYRHSSLQVFWMIRNVCLLVSTDVLPAVFEALRKACDRDLYVRWPWHMPRNVLPCR